MNERIRNLMDGCFDITVDSHGREECTADYINVQRFADLIVLECIKMIENEAAQYAQPTWAVELVNDIKENFGIEREWTQESKDWVIKNFGIEP
jgi:hypothetical protein